MSVKSMNRRSFLSFLTGAAVVAADLERLLWVPGRRLISIPRTFSCGQLFTPHMIEEFTPAKYPSRMDVMWGDSLQRAKWSVRVAG